MSVTVGHRVQIGLTGWAKDASIARNEFYGNPTY